jgi:hypothetical protein
VSHVPPLPCSNRFSTLEINDDFEPKRNDEDTRNPLDTARPPAAVRKVHQLKWEKRLGPTLVIQLLEEGLNCIMLPIHLKMMDTMEEAATEAMVNTGATGDFIDQDFVDRTGLPT